MSLKGESENGNVFASQSSTYGLANLVDDAVKLNLIKIDDTSEELEVVASTFGNFDKCASIFWKTAPTPARSWLQKLITNSLVLPNSFHDVVNVCPNVFA